MSDLFDDELAAAEAALAAHGQDKKRVRMLATRARRETRRTKSESHLAEVWPACLEVGTSYHFMSAGDVDALSYLAMILREHPLELLVFSTWCMSMQDVEQLDTWLNEGKIGRIDAYCGEIFPNQYCDEHATLCDVVRPAGGRVAVFRTHAKIFAGFGDSIAFAIESSANINTNPCAEQTAVHVDEDLARFYKDYFDGVKSFNRDFDTWQPFADA